MSGSAGEKVLNLMLIGRTGSGKSATGNTILGKRMFRESATTSSVTKDVVVKFTQFDNFSVKVVDSPSLMDTAMDSGDDKTRAALNMVTAPGICNGGVDAFILVTKRGRFTEEQRKSLEALKKIFGDRYMDNLIVVVTCGDLFKGDMEHDGRGDISFKEWCSQERGAFKQLYDDFSDRFLLINNREQDPQKNKNQRRAIIQLADTLRKQNGRNTSNSFEEAKAAIDKLIVQENLPMLKESKQTKVGLLVADLLKLQEAPTKGERGKIIQSVDDLKKEITKKDKGTGLHNHLLTNVEQLKTALHDVDQRHCQAEGFSASYVRTADLTSVAETGTSTVISASEVAPLHGPSVATLARLLNSGASFSFDAGTTGRPYQRQQDLSKSEKKIQAEENARDRKDEKELLTLLLMGKTGHGKSSLGNCILGYETFNVSNNTNSQTAEIECAYSDVERFSLKVVDGPGLQDTKLSELEETERAVLNMSKTLTMCCEGVDAFLFVFRFGGRFTREEVSVLETLKAIFGKDYLKHAIVVLTHGDLFEMKEITFDDWCKTQTGPFKELYDACDGRCVLFNNNETDEKKQMAQREQLTQLVHNLKRRHGRYTADCFKRATSERQRMIITLKQPILKEEIQKQSGILFSKIENYCEHQCAKQRAEIERGTCKLKNEIKTEDKGPVLLIDLMKNLDEIERNIHNVTELSRLAKKLENIRKAAKIWNWVGTLCNVVGGVLSLVFPVATGLITKGCIAVNAFGTGIINKIEHTTETEIKAIKSNMSTTVPASNAT